MFLIFLPSFITWPGVCEYDPRRVIQACAYSWLWNGSRLTVDSRISGIELHDIPKELVELYTIKINGTALVELDLTYLVAPNSENDISALFSAHVLNLLNGRF